MNVLWIGKTGDGNAWYHITLVASAESVKRVTVVRGKKPSRQIDSNKVVFVESGERGSFFKDLWRLYFTGARVLRKNKIDFIATFNVFPYGFLSFLLALVFRKRLLLCFIGSDYNKYYDKTLTQKAILIAVKYARVVICKGTHMIPGLTRSGVPEEKLSLYPHFVDSPYFINPPANPRYDLINISEFIPGKNIPIIVQAIERLREKGIRVTACIVGDGPKLASVREMVESKGLSDQIELPGYQKDVLAYLSQGKFYVQTSSHEGLSLSLMEAYAAGLVPIVTEAGSERDVITDGEDGRFIEIGSAESLAMAIEELLKPEIYMSYLTHLSEKKTRYSLDSAGAAMNRILEPLNGN